MKKVGIIAILALGILGTSACASKKTTPTTTEKQQTMTVSGEIIAIENGKDGYMATIKDGKGKEYVATISIVNLNKSGGTYKSHKVGDKITVKGPFWKGGNNTTYITVAELN